MVKTLTTKHTNKPLRQGFRYVTPEGAEAEFQPGSRGRVLRNLRGITPKGEMDRVEYEALIVAQETFLERIGTDTRFTADMICDMHRTWLGSLYPWAGTYRTVELQKGSFRWPPAFRVAQNMQTFEDGLLRKDTPCRPGTLKEVAGRLAEVHAEMLLIHPFRDGNGRLGRWLADLMALQAGLPTPQYDFSGRGQTARRERYLAAVNQGYGQDYEPLAGFFAEAIGRRMARPG